MTRSPSFSNLVSVTSMWTSMPSWTMRSCRLRIISRPVRSPTWQSRRYVLAPKARSRSTDGTRAASERTRSEEHPGFVNDARHQKSDIHVRERDREHAVPRPGSVLGVRPVEQHDDPVPEPSGPRPREAIDPAAHEIPERVAGQAVGAQQDDIDQQHDGTQAKEEMPGEHEGAHDIDPQKEQHDQAQQQEVAVIVIEDPGKSRLAAVAAALQFLDGASRWVPEE